MYPVGMPEIQLRGGVTTHDPKLDRVPQFDVRSRDYGIRSLIPASSLKNKVWFFGGAPYRSGQNLDQGNEGACVGFGWTGELISSPSVKRFKSQEIANAYARGFYAEAKKNDEWPGEDYEGSSVLAGAKVAALRGYIPEYRWAFGIDDLVGAVSHIGPVVVGTDWTEDMDNVLPNGLLSGTGGKVRGGHCYLIRGLILNPSKAGGYERLGLDPVLRITNSWGKSYGRNGDVFVKVDDFEKLLKNGGEACIPMRRESSAL